MVVKKEIKMFGNNRVLREMIAGLFTDAAKTNFMTFCDNYSQIDSTICFIVQLIHC